SPRAPAPRRSCGATACAATCRWPRCRWVFPWRSCVGIPDSETLEHGDLAALHFHAITFAGLVVVACEMQRAVHHHVGPVGIDRLAVAYRLAADHVGADHQVTEWQVRIDGHAALRLLGRRERKHVGGLVLATP